MKKIYKVVIIFLFIFLPLNIFADVGPKPSVNINVSGCSNNMKYYMTLFSKKESTGPFSKDYALEYFPELNEINLKFSKVDDKDSFNYLGYLEEMKGNDNFSWSYYPPNEFKIAIYLPNEDLVLISNKYESYAFNSYYKMTFKNLDLDSKRGVYYFSEDEIEIERNYNYTREFILLILRISLTIFVEYLVAILMFKPNRYQKNLIVKTNILTQIILNATFNIILYFRGFILYLILLIPLEILIFVIEAYIYKKKLNNAPNKSKREAPAILYSFIANCLSAVVGYYFVYYFTFNSFVIK